MNISAPPNEKDDLQYTPVAVAVPVGVEAQDVTVAVVAPANLPEGYIFDTGIVYNDIL